MEFEDILYLILMLVFAVFGIFNDSKKRKKRVGEATQPVNREEEFRDVFREIFQNSSKQQTPPPVPRNIPAEKNRRKSASMFQNSKSRYQGFQSSLDLVTNFEGESSLKGSLYVSESLDRREAGKQTDISHPVLECLRGSERSTEVRKAVIYSEILKRKY